ncbi:MAG: T9SS type A sorting domain-containing protein [Bacteroidota bacterium]
MKKQIINIRSAVFTLFGLLCCLNVFAQGSGVDGAVTVAANSNFYSLANTAKTALTANAASGQPTITVASNTNFPNSTLVLVIQMLGTNYGVYEEKTVSSSTATSLTFTANLTNSYYGTGSNKAQAIRVMQYTNFTINAGVTLTVDAWDGSTGGIMYIYANGTFTMTSTSIITANGAGFRGGAGGAGGAGGTGGAGGATAGAAGAPGAGGSVAGNGTGGAAGASCSPLGQAGGAGGLKGTRATGSIQVNGEGKGITSGPLILGVGGDGGQGGCGGGGGGGGGAGGLDGSGCNNTAWVAGGAGGDGGAGGAGATGGNGGGCIWITCNTVVAPAGASITANGAAGAQGSFGVSGAVGGAGGKGAGALCGTGTSGGGGGGGDAGDNGDSGGGSGGGGGGQIKLTFTTGPYSGTRTASTGGGGGGRGGIGAAAVGGSAGAGGTGGCGGGTGGAAGSGGSSQGGGGSSGCGGTGNAGGTGTAGGAGSAGTGSSGTGGTEGRNGNGGGGSGGGCSGTSGSTTGANSGLGGAGGLSVCTTVILPIELLSFYAQTQNKSVHLTWATASELNNDYFTLEKTLDGEDYREVTRIKGAGHSSHILNYKFTDDNPFTGFSYYRLKQTDYNGDFSYSYVVPVKFSTGYSISIDLYPNPVIATVEVKYYAKNANALSFKVLDITGKIIHTYNKEIELGENTFMIDIKNIVKGIYFMEITNGEETVFKKIIKE